MSLIWHSDSIQLTRPRNNQDMWFVDSLSASVLPSPIITFPIITTLKQTFSLNLFADPLLNRHVHEHIEVSGLSVVCDRHLVVQAQLIFIEEQVVHESNQRWVVELLSAVLNEVLNLDNDLGCGDICMKYGLSRTSRSC